jgi:hypothetical protein
MFSKKKEDKVEISKISEKSSQELFNSRLKEHIKFNKKQADILKNTIQKQSNTIQSYTKSESQKKKITILKDLNITIKRFFAIELKKDKELLEEINIVERQTASTIKEIEKGKIDRKIIIKFLKSPYKKEYKSEEIDKMLEIIEHEKEDKKKIEKEIGNYKKALEKSITHYYKNKKLKDFNRLHNIVEEKIEEKVLIENKGLLELQKEQEEIVYSSFKLLKSNVEIALLMDETVKAKEFSKLFETFLKDLNQKLESAYKDIGSKEIKKLLDEIEEDIKTKNAEKIIEIKKEEVKKEIKKEIIQEEVKEEEKITAAAKEISKEQNKEEK